MRAALLLALASLASLAVLTGCSSMPTIPALDRELAALVGDPQAPVAAVAALAIRDGRVVYANQFGIRHPAAPPLPVTEATRFRVASISKLVVGLSVMRMVEAGRLDLDADVSGLLGWTLRHPQFPEVPITLRLLLSHRSGLADGGERYWFDGRTQLQDVLQPQGALYADGLNWRRGNRPGTHFEYVNLNYGVIAQVMERAGGERFDRLMQRLVLAPLGLGGGFDPSQWPREQQLEVAAMVRKRGDDGSWNPAGPWVLQADDFRDRPAQAPAGVDDYVVGSNGTLFGPQGRLRVSVRELGVVMQMLLDQGRHQGRAFLQPASVALLAGEQWRRRGAPPADGENVGACAWGIGVQIFTDRAEPGCGDRLVDGGGFQGWGHTGDAYGLMGLFALDPAARRGMVVVVNGPGVDPQSFPARYSALYRWQEIAATAVWRHALQGASLRP